MENIFGLIYQKIGPLYGICVSKIQGHTDGRELYPTFGQPIIMKEYLFGITGKKKGPLLKKLDPFFGIISVHHIFSNSMP